MKNEPQVKLSRRQKRARLRAAAKNDQATKAGREQLYRGTKLSARQQYAMAQLMKTDEAG